MPPRALASLSATRCSAIEQAHGAAVLFPACAAHGAAAVTEHVCPAPLHASASVPIWLIHIARSRELMRAAGHSHH
eukprot:2127352-Pyramimonas_sp.AAC.1